MSTAAITAVTAPAETDDISKRLARKQLAVRAGDLMQVGYDLRLAIQIAELALDLVPGQGMKVAELQRMLQTLKGGG